MWWRAVRRRWVATARPASSAAAGAEKSCRAVVVPRFGGPEVLEVRQGMPVPDLKPQEVLVRARAVSINPLDLRVSSPFWTHAPPSIGFKRKRLMKIFGFWRFRLVEALQN
jgi:reticulon-4-interacting protein 1, mitochondrial